MQITVEKLSPVLVELQVEVPADRVRTEVEKAYATLQRTARVKGFRPGKAPRNVLAHLYGGRVHADVAQRLMDSTLTQALADKQVEPISRPALAPSALRPDDAFSYKARFEVRPVIGAVKWEGLEFKRPPTVATDEMIEAELAKLRREHAPLQAPDPERPAQEGDVVTVSLTVTAEGTPLSETTDQQLDIEIGLSAFPKDLEEALRGTTPGQEKDVPITFTDGHPRPDLRGKAGNFHVVVKEVKERILPALDDELAKDAGAESLEALRVTVRARLEHDLKRRAEEEFGQQFIFEICKHNPIPVPPSLVETQAQEGEREYLAAMRRNGQRVTMTAELRGQLRYEAELKVRTGLLMAEIAREKGLRITEEDLDKAFVELAQETGKNVAKVRAEHRDQKKREYLAAMILEDKILTMAEAAAIVTEAP